MFEPRRPAGRHDADLPAELRPFVAAWRAEPEVPPDLAASVVAALRVERAAPPISTRPRWRHAAAAVLAAGVLVGVGVMWEPAEPNAATVAAAPPPLAEPAPAQAEEVPVEVPRTLAAAPPRARFVAFAPPLPEPGAWLSRDRLAEAWAAVPVADPGRTWRDEVADGVRPLRRGAETAIGLFARAVPPPPRSL